MKQTFSPGLNSFAVAVCLLLVCSLPLGATTYLLMSDESLADQAPVIAEIEIVKALESRWSEPPVTEYFGVVQSVLKGKLKSTITIQVPGGESPDGFSLYIPSVPEFENGEKVLLFLSPNADGSYEILHWALGTFRIRPAQAHHLAVRDVTEAHVLSADEQGIQFHRHYEKFAAWLNDRATGKYREADYFEPLELSSRIESYTLFKFRGKRVRWFDFDGGSPVKWRLRSSGSVGSLTAFRDALKAWNRERKTNVNYTYSGSTGSRAGFNRRDGINAIIFGDPNRNLSGRFNCNSGGVIAAGGWWTKGIKGTFSGRSHYRIVEGDIVVNNGAECLIRNRKAAGQLFAHELGHTLGIAHSCGDAASGPCNTSRKTDALMRAFFHNDGRGSALRADDKAALRQLYKGGGGTDPPGGSLAAPTNLTARATSSTTGALRWKDNSSQEKEFLVKIKIGSFSWQRWLVFPANTIGVNFIGATPGQTYKFTVIAKNGSASSSRSNIATVKMPP